MTISITNVAKNSLKISAVQTIGAAVALLATMYVATIVFRRNTAFTVSCYYG